MLLLLSIISHFFLVLIENYAREVKFSKQNIVCFGADKTPVTNLDQDVPSRFHVGSSELSGSRSIS